MTIEDLLIFNEQQADLIYGSAFYYGNNTEQDWKKMMTNYLNQATMRGIKYGSNHQRAV